MSSTPIRVALITGTSRGIGTALAAAFAAEGYAVVGSSRSAGPDVDVAGVDYRRCDVSDSAAIRDLVAGTVAVHGRLDGWSTTRQSRSRAPSRRPRSSSGMRC